MEECLMATSLLFAVLGVAGEVEAQAAPDGTRAQRYSQLSRPAKRRVQKALYEAFYPILETGQVTYPGPTRAIGEILARLISGQLPTAAELAVFAQGQDVTELAGQLRVFVDAAIADEEA